MNIVVIGGSGLIGTKLVNKLRQLGHEVVAASPSSGVNGIAQSATDGQTVRLSPALVQPIVSDDVADALAEVTLGAPVNGTIEIAGPERLRLDELVRRFLSAKQDARQVVADVHARYFGLELNDQSLTPGDNPRIGPTRFEDWLSRSIPQR